MTIGYLTKVTIGYLTYLLPSATSILEKALSAKCLLNPFFESIDELQFCFNISGKEL